MSNNKFSKETAVLREIVVQAKALPFSKLYFSLFCVRVSLGYILPLVKKEDTDLLFLSFFCRFPPSEVF